MRTMVAGQFQDSVSYWFDHILEEMGATLRNWVYDFLGKKGIGRNDIASRFGDVLQILLERLGTSAQVIAYRTMVELYKEFSLTADFTYGDSLLDKFSLLKDRVVTDHLRPRIVRTGNASNGFGTSTSTR